MQSRHGAAWGPEGEDRDHMRDARATTSDGKGPSTIDAVASFLNETSCDPQTMVSLPSDLFQRCMSPTDSSTPIRLHTDIQGAVGQMRIEAFASLDVAEYEKLGGCRRSLLSSPTPIAVSEWSGPDEDLIETDLEQGHWRIEWQGSVIHMVTATWRDGWNPVSRTWLIAEREEVIEAFALDVARKTNDPGEAILVFHGSCWQRSRELWTATQEASFDNLILAHDLKKQIRGDFRQFLNARPAYEELGLAWRRGALFVGPPGNGKTHCLRALVKELAIPSLYVQSVKDRYQTDESNLRRVFERARQLRPCVLIFEDLDALVTPDNRSFFLNQLDGFEKNIGLVVLATTNHPERIDPAILDRPSRFDRKYHFDLPALEERRAYLTLWQNKLADKTNWQPETTLLIAERTTGFSFAYLKELVVSSLTKWVAGAPSFGALLERECADLAAEMATRPGVSATTHVTGDVDDDGDEV